MNGTDITSEQTGCLTHYADTNDNIPLLQLYVNRIISIANTAKFKFSAFDNVYYNVEVNPKGPPG